MSKIHKGNSKKNKNHNKRKSTKSKENENIRNSKKSYKPKGKQENSKEKNLKNDKFLDGFNEEQKEMYKNGTLKDKIDMISLIILKDYTNENMKNLLSFCENQHNDTIYYAINNIKNIMLELDIDIIDGYISGRILKTFEIQAKSKYIGSKILNLVEKLIKAGIFVNDFISILINMINSYKSKFLNDNFTQFENEILENIEDFYFKNDNFRSQANILKFLVGKKGKSVFDFINKISVDEKYSEAEKDILYERIIFILHFNLEFSKQTGCDKHNIRFGLLEYIKNYKGNNDKIYLKGIQILGAVKNNFYNAFVLKNCIKINNLCKNNREKEIIFIQEIYKNGNSDLIYHLTNNIYAFSTCFIIGMLLLCQEHEIRPYSLFTFSMHWDPKVREISKKIIDGEKIQMFDPFDSINQI
ncbi:hypothetical protein EHP00_1443 [Ecytonucleospora hepatopenaei]|uniref:Uncharacterized protein n=1 Tax=Ecytonucleospora hepatopenaei TaxID=646526 RepID=A0A1W0E7K7_9MICR|nr:hypothetical protein EHP00_1443 [Ecytonucleospora hepatopenaei]